MKKQKALHLAVDRNLTTTNVTDPKDIKDLDQLEELVDELMKQKPQEERIKAYMKNVGLEYVADPIARLGTVLHAIEKAR